MMWKMQHSAPLDSCSWYRPDLQGAGQGEGGLGLGLSSSSWYRPDLQGAGQGEGGLGLGLGLGLDSGSL